MTGQKSPLSTNLMAASTLSEVITLLPTTTTKCNVIKLLHEPFSFVTRSSLLTPCERQAIVLGALNQTPFVLAPHPHVSTHGSSGNVEFNFVKMAILPFCEAGDSDSIIWRNGGFSRCFLTIFGSLFTSGLAIILGLSLAILGGKPRATPKQLTWRPLVYSKTFIMETLSCLLLSLSFITHLILHGVLLNKNTLYGYTILTDITSSISWLFCLYLICRERFNVLFTISHSPPIVVFWLSSALWLCLETISWSNSEWWWDLSNVIDTSDLVLFCIRSFLLLLLVGFGVIRPLIYRRGRYQLLVNLDDTDQPTVISSQDHEDPNKSGSFSRKSSHGSTFGSLWAKTKLLFPYIWPKGHLILQLRVVICFILLGGGRVINVYVPIYYKTIVNALSPNVNTTHSFDLAHGLTASNGVTFPYVSILIYVILRFMQGGSTGSTGFINNFRVFLWIRVQQYTSRAMQVKLFSHLHGLSLRWHLGRKTGEILRVMDRTTQSINNLLSYILFSIFPTIVDIIVAVVYFVIAFDAWFGLIVFTTMVAYLLYTIAITEWRTKYRRLTNERDNEVKAKGVDSLINFETVKYYGREDFEVERFRDVIIKFQLSEWKSLASLNVLNVGQNFIITIGLLVGSFLCAYR